MSQNSQDQPEEQEILILGPQGQDDDTDGDDQRHVTELVEQPAKVMRIGTMIGQLLEEVKLAPLDEASRNRIQENHPSSIKNRSEERRVGKGWDRWCWTGGAAFHSKKTKNKQS